MGCIKSVQFGTFNGFTSPIPSFGSKEINISSVDTTKSILIINDSGFAQSNLNSGCTYSLSENKIIVSNKLGVQS